MIHNYYGQYKNVILKPLNHNEIEPLRIWRNNSEATRFLRRLDYITEEMQENWYNDYKNDKDIVIFAIYETQELNRMVGSVALYNFRNDVAEIGKIQIGDNAAHGRGIGKMALVIAMKIGFELMKINKIDACVHQQNIAAYKNDIAIGFQVVANKESSVGGLEDIIEITYSRLKEINKYVDEIKVGIKGE